MSVRRDTDGMGAAVLAQAAESGDAQRGIILDYLSGGTRLHTLIMKSTPIVSDDGSARGTMATFDNMTNVERRNNQFRQTLDRLQRSKEGIRKWNREFQDLATQDPLTGCANRRTLFGELERLWSAAKRDEFPLSAVMLEIDHFQSINDRFGHRVGDQVLQQLVTSLKSAARDNDLVARHSDNEFCILLPGTDLDAAVLAAERLREIIATTSLAGITITASLGVSSLSLGSRDFLELLEQADKCLKVAKRGGRNRVVAWDQVAPGMEAAAGEQSSVALNDDALPDAAKAAIPFQLVTGLLAALVCRHAETAEHSCRVADLCVATASNLMTVTECYELELAALLHDIGKLGVPDAVLLKPGPLTPDEWTVMRSQERIGKQLISAVFSSESLSETITMHHSFLGGSSCSPELPSGEAIPLGSRIILIADAYDAMVSDHCYRKGRTRNEAFAELIRCSGTQFDPHLVERFIASGMSFEDSRSRDLDLNLSKQTAQKIGVHVEGLANAADSRDRQKWAATAGRLNETATYHGIVPIAEAAAALELSLMNGLDEMLLMEMTVDLIDLCRTGYGAYIPKSNLSDDSAEKHSPIETALQAVVVDCPG